MDTEITTGSIHNTPPYESTASGSCQSICKWNRRLALQKEAAVAGASIVSVRLVPPRPRTAVGGGAASDKDESERKGAAINRC